MTHARQHRVVWTLTAFVFAFGVYFALIAVMDPNPAKTIIFAIVSALNIVGGIWVLVGRRKSEEHDNSHR